jgi:hypothetical protein
MMKKLELSNSRVFESSNFFIIGVIPFLRRLFPSVGLPSPATMTDNVPRSAVAVFDADQVPRPDGRLNAPGV